MKRQILLSTVLSGLYIALNAQQNSINNYNLSPVFLNPSFAGSNGLFRANASYQGAQFVGSSKLSMSMDGFIGPLNGGLALTHSDESLGPVSRILTAVTYAQHIDFTDKHLTVIPSLQVGYGSNSIAGEWIAPPNAYTKNPVTYFRINSGLLLNYRKNFFAGIALENINRPDVGYYDSYRSPLNITYHSSYTFKLGSRSLLQAMGRVQQSTTSTNFQLSVNAILYKHLILGAAFTDSEKFQFVLGGRTNNLALQVIYCGHTNTEYDIDTYEVHFSYNLRKKEIRNNVPLFEKM